MKGKIAIIILLVISSLFSSVTVWGEENAVNQSTNEAQDENDAANNYDPSNKEDGDMTTSNFTLDPSTFSPSEKSGDYIDLGSKGNIMKIIDIITGYLLIAISTTAGLLIVVGGAMMATSGGNNDRVSKGKAIITFSITGLVIALLSYSIIKFITWVLG